MRLPGVNRLVNIVAAKELNCLGAPCIPNRRCETELAPPDTDSLSVFLIVLVHIFGRHQTRSVVHSILHRFSRNPVFYRLDVASIT